MLTSMTSCSDSTTRMNIADEEGGYEVEKVPNDV